MKSLKLTQKSPLWMAFIQIQSALQMYKLTTTTTITATKIHSKDILAERGIGDLQHYWSMFTLCVLRQCSLSIQIVLAWKYEWNLTRNRTAYES